MFRYDFDAENETRIAGASTDGASEVLPSIWRDRVVFVRVYEERSGTRGTYPYIYTRPLDGDGGSVREEGGSRGTDGLPGPTRLDLYGRRLSFVWNYSTGTPQSGRIAGTSEVRPDDVDSSDREVLSQADFGDSSPGGFASYSGPTGSAGRSFYGFERIEPQGEARPTSTTSLLLRHRITTGQRGAANGPGLLVDTATDNAVTVTATSPNQGSTGPTRITRNDDTTYSRLTAAPRAAAQPAAQVTEPVTRR
ncbi:MAG: hypothetical protein MSC31_05465 [Solirubrobacteraceae bacterium MAG38_C4-C5]|nr:hypothetical protein [Candidatus Siliceabacter maunaloa]